MTNLEFEFEFSIDSDKNNKKLCKLKYKSFYSSKI